MRRRAAWPVLLTVIAVAAIWTLASLGRWKTEDDIREAVFRYQMRCFAQEKPDVFFLSVTTFGFDRSPSSSFLRRFKSPISAFSECTQVGAETVRRAGTFEEGLILRVGRVKWLSASETEVAGGYYQNGTSASGNVYRLAKQQERWVVVGDKLIWIS